MSLRDDYRLRNALREDVRRLSHELRVVEERIREVESRDQIAAQGITRDQVQASSGPNIPWHWHLSGFVEWLKAQPVIKPYAEWNGRVYRTSDLVAGRVPDTPMLMDHIPAEVTR